MSVALLPTSFLLVNGYLLYNNLIAVDDINTL